MIKYIYPDDTICYRALHSVHAVYTDDDGKLVSRVTTPEGTYKTFEIKGFELLQSGQVYP